MVILLDKVLLILCSIFPYMLHVNTQFVITPILVVLILGSLSTFFENRWFQFILFIIFLILSFQVPAYAYFLPVMIYDILKYPYRFTAFAMLVPIAFYYKDLTSIGIVSILLFTLLSIYIEYRSRQILQMTEEYNLLRDTSKELSILQEEKNRSMQENQDYEINVATLNERNRISKEIHDNIGHLLSRTLLQIGALLTIIKEPMVKESLTDLNESLSQGMDSIRASIHNMHDESIDIYTTIQAILKDFTFCPVHLDYDIKNPPNLKIKYCLIHTVKESLSNIMKHSNGTQVQIILREHPALYQCIIMDNGTFSDGMKYKLTHALRQGDFSDGLGLQGIMDRVKGFGGNINFSIEDGFKTFITIPKEISN